MYNIVIPCQENDNWNQTSFYKKHNVKFPPENYSNLTIKAKVKILKGTMWWLTLTKIMPLNYKKPLP